MFTLPSSCIEIRQIAEAEAASAATDTHTYAHTHAQRDRVPYARRACLVCRHAFYLFAN